MTAAGEATEGDHERHMRRAIALAELAVAAGEAPVGSVVVDAGVVIAEGAEAVRQRADVTAHAEIEALRAAFRVRRSRDLTGCTLYTTVEPCVMCAYAIRLAHIALVVSGTPSGDTKWPVSGRAVLADPAILPSHPPPVVHRGVLEAICAGVRTTGADPA